MVADQQTRSAGAQIPGKVGRSAQTDDDGCDIFAELLPPAAAIDHPTVDEWGVEGGDGGGRGWNLSCLCCLHTQFPTCPQKCAKASLLEINFCSNN